MSSVSNTPRPQVTGAQTDKQKDLSQKVQDAAQKKGDATAAGNSAGIKEASSQLKSLLGQAAKDGFSKADIKNLESQSHSDAVGGFLGGQKKAGKPIDDKVAAATLHNDYDGYCKSRGLDAKASGSFDKWKSDVTPSLQKAGLTDDDVSKSLKAAQDFRFNNPGTTIGALQRRDVKV